MMNIKLSLALIITLLVSCSCKKAGGGSKITEQPAPSGLIIAATASTDGSGNVAFTATANNASTYAFEFGDGVVQTAVSGVIAHQYTLVGTNIFTVTVTATGSTGLTVKKSEQVSVSVAAGNALLVWSDEFNTNGAPDPGKWGYDLGNNNGWGNSELEYYTNRRENSIVENGVLKIKAVKESYQGFAYTSARLLSKDKFDFKYGKVEARVKLPAGVGTWPAVWALGSDISSVGWPACGEIDIMEHKGSELNKIYATLHYPGRSGGNANGSTKMISNATTEFHIYTLEWSASFIKVFVDDQLVHSVANSASIPFNHNFFLILNLAIGGSFAGAVDPALTSAVMEIDYIRVYK